MLGTEISSEEIKALSSDRDRWSPRGQLGFRLWLSSGGPGAEGIQTVAPPGLPAGIRLSELECRKGRRVLKLCKNFRAPVLETWDI